MKYRRRWWEEELVTWVGDVKDYASDPKLNKQKVPSNPIKEWTMNRSFPEGDMHTSNKYIKRHYVETSTGV